MHELEKVRKGQTLAGSLFSSCTIVKALLSGPCSLTPSAAFDNMLRAVHFGDKRIDPKYVSQIATQVLFSSFFFPVVTLFQMHGGNFDSSRRTISRRLNKREGDPVTSCSQVIDGEDSLVRLQEDGSYHIWSDRVFKLLSEIDMECIIADGCFKYAYRGQKGLFLFSISSQRHTLFRERRSTVHAPGCSG